MTRKLWRKVKGNFCPKFRNISDFPRASNYTNPLLINILCRKFPTRNGAQWFLFHFSDRTEVPIFLLRVRQQPPPCSCAKSIKTPQKCMFFRHSWSNPCPGPPYYTFLALQNILFGPFRSLLRDIFVENSLNKRHPLQTNLEPDNFWPMFVLDSSPTWTIFSDFSALCVLLLTTKAIKTLQNSRFLRQF